MGTLQTDSNSPEHILLVDDQPELLTVNSKLLTSVGYRVDAVPSGQEAVDFVKQQDVDLIVLDMVMPGMDGEETLRQILACKPDQKVVILSAFAETEKVEAVKALGVYGYLQKPFVLKTMLQVLRDALDGKISGDL
jgi:CheY-like chemotaxis protein